MHHTDTTVEFEESGVKRMTWRQFINTHYRTGLAVISLLLVFVWTVIVVSDASAHQYVFYHNEETGRILSRMSSVFIGVGYLVALCGALCDSNKALVLGLVTCCVLNIFLTGYFNATIEIGGHDASALPHSVSCVVASLKGDICRRNYIEHTLANRHIPFEFVDVYDIANASAVSQFPIAKRFGTSANVVMTASMSKAIHIGAQRAVREHSKWVLVLEDDAFLDSYFNAKLAQELETIGDVDIIWLDVRAYNQYKFVGSIPCCTAGIMYRADRAEEIAEALVSLNPALMRIVEDRKLVPPNDLHLAAFCNFHYYKCTVIPLVAEYQFPSDH